MKSFHLYMTMDYWGLWPGTQQRFELTVLDTLALSLYLSLPRASDPLPFRVAISFYLLSTLLSVPFATVPEAALFYSWQLARMFLLYAVVVRAVRQPARPHCAAQGVGRRLFTAGAGCAVAALRTGHAPDARDHGPSNELGMLSHLIVFPFFALLLTGRAGRWPAVLSGRGNCRTDDDIPRHDRTRRDGICACFCSLGHAGMDVPQERYAVGVRCRCGGNCARGALCNRAAGR